MARFVKPKRRYTRRVCSLSLFFCACIIGFLTLFGQEGRLAETIVTGAFTLYGAIIGTYVLGGAWDYHNVLRKVKNDEPLDY